MARPKGFKLSPEQKTRMQEGRKRKAAERRVGLVDADETPRPKKAQGFMIIGYAIEKDGKWPVPVFSSEKGKYKQVFKSLAKAKAVLSGSADMSMKTEDQDERR